MDDNVTLRVNGREWGGWTSVRIGAGVERLARDFSIEITRQWPGENGDTLRPKVKGGDRVEVLIGTDLVITGWVEATPVRYDARSVSVGISGRSLTADLIDCAAEPTQFNGQSLVQVAAALARPFGIDVINSGAPADVIPGVQPDHGETVIEVLNKMPKKVAGTGFQRIRYLGSAPGMMMISARPPQRLSGRKLKTPGSGGTGQWQFSRLARRRVPAALPGLISKRVSAPPELTKQRTPYGGGARVTALSGSLTSV